MPATIAGTWPARGSATAWSSSAGGSSNETKLESSQSHCAAARKRPRDAAVDAAKQNGDHGCRLESPAGFVEGARKWQWLWMCAPVGRRKSGCRRGSCRGCAPRVAGDTSCAAPSSAWNVCRGRRPHISVTTSSHEAVAHGSVPRDSLVACGGSPHGAAGGDTSRDAVAGALTVCGGLLMVI